MEDLETRPERKAMKRKNGLKYISLYGNLKSPKIENRGRGKTHYNWKGGITPIRTIFCQSIEYKEWRNNVFKRDDYKCVICKVNTHALQADHIKPYSLYPDLRIDVDNGRTLCKECHRKYGACVAGGKLIREATNGSNWVA